MIDGHGVAIVALPMYWGLCLFVQCECGKYKVYNDVTTLESVLEWYSKHLYECI